jgi:hypothetical protein
MQTAGKGEVGRYKEKVESEFSEQFAPENLARHAFTEHPRIRQFLSDKIDELTGCVPEKYVYYDKIPEIAERQKGFNECVEEFYENLRKISEA